MHNNSHIFKNHQSNNVYWSGVEILTKQIWSFWLSKKLSLHSGILTNYQRICTFVVVIRALFGNQVT